LRLPNRASTAVWSSLAVLALCGCTDKRHHPAEELASALRAHGVVYDMSETAALSGVRGDGLRLTGPGLVVELYAISDRAEWEQAVTAAARAAEMLRQRGATHELKHYARRPFLVIVRQEPTGGQVGAALAAIWGS